LQDAIAALTTYWAGHGCAIMQPYNTEVGAGTYNPATFLRVLGPEPWRVGYVEPSVRPDDARYGENPNRIQTHTQFQVILKPDPGNSQDLYLGSLAALGIDLAAHDVRFVEDNWTSPAIGAWGLGWEVWLDGLEITQFTYFQQAGGFSLDPVSVELTYGLERILMALQGVRHFKEIAYAEGLPYGDVFGQAEYEWSRYYLDDADTDAVAALFAIYEREAQQLIAKRLPVPAYSYVLKCSHTFNILDARGDISTTERARSFARMRRLAHQVAELWIERRQEEGFPLGEASHPGFHTATVLTEGNPPAAPATLAFEIGVEELPAADVTTAAQGVRHALATKLAATRLEHGLITVEASPRRISAVIEAVAPVEPDTTQLAKGPRRSAAFDDAGAPTKAAEGFARSQGVTVEQLSTTEVKGVEHVAYERAVPGRPALEVLGTVLSSVISELRSPDKNMRWGAPSISFARPIRWVLALLGEAVVPVGVADLRADRFTRVLRFDAAPQRSVPDADAYLPTLAGAGIVIEAARRRRLIEDQAAALADGAGGHAELASGLLDEVTNLVEVPHSLLGHFDPGYLELPEEILVTVMRKHQRYFPLRDDQGMLLPAFIAVANGPCDDDLVRSGNESVLRARYEDARFFFNEDLRRKPEEFRTDLDRLTFAEQLGSMGDRSARIERIALILADRLDPGAISPVRDTLERAGALVKFDLATQMVTELTSLAGVMAREYALLGGEPEGVALALFEQELPRHSSDDLPSSLPGALLSLANRADLLAGLFAIGAEPTGSSDPYALRRAALGLLAVLEATPTFATLGIAEVLEVAGAAQPVPWAPEIARRVIDFVARRWETQQLDNGYPADVVRAVAPQFGRPAAAAATLRWLVAQRNDPALGLVAQAIGRAARIVPAGTATGWDPSSDAEPAEAALRGVVEALDRRLGPGPLQLPAFVAAAAELVEPIDQFFGNLMVMSEDPAVQAGRLGLLASVVEMAQRALDWTELV
jgi:glycyl-tRNA synthetase